MPETNKLKNGLRTILVPFPGTEAVTVLVMIKVGSRYETPELSGASHFIEHMMFKGTKRRPTTLDISKELDSVGASYNAFTSKGYTGYYAKVPAEHFSLAVDLLHDMIFHSKYAPAEMARERKVIIEEINMYEDNPSMYIEDLLEMKLLAGSPLGWSIAGTRKTMTDMKRSAVIDFRDKYYQPSRLVVAAAGKLSGEAEKIIKAKFGQALTPAVAGLWRARPNPSPRGRGEKGVGESEEGLNNFVPYKNTGCACCWPKVITQFKDTQQVQLAMGFISPGLNDEKNDLVADILGTILGGTMSSRLFIAIRERKGLAYSIKAGQGAYEDVGTFVIRAGLDKSRLPMAAKVIFSELKKVKKSGVTPAELNLAKNNLIGSLKLSLEDSSSQANYYAHQELLLNKIESPEALCRRIQKVSTKEIQAMANKILGEENMTVAGIGPFKTDKDLLKEIGL
ncbi:MAG: pitrilysin family protein [Candidatus Uhrbacteria bacterium]